ncbi:hypothetical protein Syun_018905 [Stephania yunnanensis]|uniref:Antimicrobial peptide 1 n=1 Tax=Stephania yunnanensis TaxID=152371 RepID=A0AAP0IT43_9MAGN
MASSKLSAFAMAMVLSALLIATIDMVNASNLDVWSGPGCNNRADRYIACGCHDIDPGLHGGWAFSYNGPPAFMYNQANCRGVSVRKLSRGARDCNPFPWQSMFIQC